ncbi:MAG TPA: hypothetical protein VJM32_03905 [Candidatus Saccharimonadales bacterium]|nr:hypothetical protein [Candidatus Saccharimonadales bacterium]
MPDEQSPPKAGTEIMVGDDSSIANGLNRSTDISPEVPADVVQRRRNPVDKDRDVPAITGLATVISQPSGGRTV